jgi:hypothetical protein
MDGIKTLQSVISNKKSLNTIELNDLLSSLNEITPLFIYYWDRAVKSGNLNLDIALVESINTIRNEDWLILPAIVLRNGGNPNLYINTPKVGPINIIGYVYYTLLPRVDFEIVESVQILLLFSGAKAVLPAFDATGGSIPPAYLGIYPFIVNNKISIGEWVKRQGINSIVNNIKKPLVNTLNPITDTKFGILLNNPNLIKTSGACSGGSASKTRLTMTDISNVIKYHSDKIFDNQLKWTFNGIDYVSILNSIKSLNDKTFNKLMNMGMMPSYVAINEILINLKQYYQYQLPTAVNSSVNLIVDAINHGYQMDKYQLDFVSSIDKSIVSILDKAYNKPFWEKECEYDKTPYTQKLRQLAFSLNIDAKSDKVSVCKSIKELAKSDPTSLVKSAVERQQTRVSSNLSSINEYIDTKPDIICKNRALFNIDPYEYNDVELAVYKDKNENIWCFPSNLYEDIIKTSTNPYSLQPLPPAFVNNVKNKSNIIKSLGLDFNPTPYSTAVQQLTQSDQISNEKTDNIIKSVINTARLYGINKQQLLSYTPKQLQDVLEKGGVKVNLLSLPQQLSFATFARIVNYMIKMDPKNASLIFSNI